MHDEIVVECDEEDAEKVEAWLKKAMVDGMDGVLNAPDVEGPHVSLGRNSEATAWEFRETSDGEPLW